MWVKICANTSLEDAALAASLGADALGFVFADSRRQVTPGEVAAITPRLPASVERIGVFDRHTPREIIEIVQSSGLSGVQLHGALDLVALGALRSGLGPSASIIQTLHWSLDADPPDRIANLHRQLGDLLADGSTDRVLIDSSLGATSGGNGIAFDWGEAAEVLRPVSKRLHLIVAGGLRPENVREAIGQLTPWGVDVATGVELSPGRKSPQKLQAFLEVSRKA